jgi:hypothetical protein
VNAYSYSNIDLADSFTATVGVSYDDITGDFPGDETDQVNPKLGLVWEPLQGTTLRAAAFKTLQRTLITNQTLEPTQVAGFSQFFDDPNLTEAWRYGAGLDQKFSESLFGGLEYSERELEVPFLNFGPSGEFTDNSDWDEYFGRVYLFWTLNDWVSLRAEYQYEKVERDDTYTEGLSESKTHRVPLGINVFWESGISASTTATYYDQDGDFDGEFGPVRPGDDQFWLVDATLSYRLPRRYGIFSVGVSNLLDEDFSYYDLDISSPGIQPERTFSAKLTLAFP